MRMNKEAKTIMKDDDQAYAAFLVASDKIRDAIKALPGWDACLTLTICLAECIVHGNSEDDDPGCGAPRLANTIRVLGDVTLDMMADGDDGEDPDDEDHPRPSPSSPDLLRKLLDRRRTKATS